LDLNDKQQEMLSTNVGFLLSLEMPQPSEHIYMYQVVCKKQRQVLKIDKSRNR